jgi:hypothetical protein
MKMKQRTCGVPNLALLQNNKKGLDSTCIYQIMGLCPSSTSFLISFRELVRSNLSSTRHKNMAGRECCEMAGRSVWRFIGEESVTKWREEVVSFPSTFHVPKIFNYLFNNIPLSTPPPVAAIYRRVGKG